MDWTEHGAELKCLAGVGTGFSVREIGKLEIGKRRKGWAKMRKRKGSVIISEGF